MSLAGETPRHGPHIEVQFDRPDRSYEPGGTLSLRYAVGGLGDERLRAVEHSVLWYTEGKGEEDLGVHFFERLVAPERLPPTAPMGQFSCRLPRSPLSYEGVVVKIRWCIRVRFFFESGRDYVSEHEFAVGQLPPAQTLIATP